MCSRMNARLNCNGSHRASTWSKPYRRRQPGNIVRHSLPLVWSKFLSQAATVLQ
jgi:hypothetical protein